MPRKIGFSNFAGKQFKRKMNERFDAYRQQLESRASAIEKLKREKRELEKKVEDLEKRQTELEQALSQPVFGLIDHDPEDLEKIQQLQNEFETEQLHTKILENGLGQMEKKVEEGKRTEENLRQQLKLEHENYEKEQQECNKWFNEYRQLKDDFNHLRNLWKDSMEKFQNTFDDIDHEMTNSELFD